MKKPIVPTRVEGTAEAVDEECALMIRPRDQGALADALITLALNPDKRAEPGRKARVRYCQRFHAAKQIRRLRSLYRRLRQV